jgi:hypothetical protein
MELVLAKVLAYLCLIFGRQLVARAPHGRVAATLAGLTVDRAKSAETVAGRREVFVALIEDLAARSLWDAPADTLAMALAACGLPGIEGAHVACIVREVGATPTGRPHGPPPPAPRRVIIPRPDTVIEADDHVIVFLVNKRLIPQVEKLFQVGVGYL